MNDYQKKLMQLLELEKKDETLTFVLDLLSSEKVDIVTLYETYLAPALNVINCDENDEACVWKEHIRSAIIRTIIECSYPFVIQQQKPWQGQGEPLKVLIACPQEEYHEIGARMVSDFFYLNGYQTIYIGANTPLANLISAVRLSKPDIVAISITNYYNLAVAKRVIQAIREFDDSIQIYAGGFATTLIGASETLNADRILKDYADICDLPLEVK